MSWANTRPKRLRLSTALNRSGYSAILQAVATLNLSDYFKRLGAKGGKARAANMTPAQRKASSRKAIQALKAKRRMQAAS